MGSHCARTFDEFLRPRYRTAGGAHGKTEGTLGCPGLPSEEGARGPGVNFCVRDTAPREERKERPREPLGSSHQKSGRGGGGVGGPGLNFCVRGPAPRERSVSVHGQAGGVPALVSVSRAGGGRT